MYVEPVDIPKHLPAECDNSYINEELFSVSWNNPIQCEI